MNQNKCDGTGQCLTLGDNLNEYEYLFDCENKCQPIKCPNFKLCGSIFPVHIGYCHQNRCTNCDILWGNKDIKFINIKEECQICYEIKEEYIKFQSCEHRVCIECFDKLTHCYPDENGDIVENKNEGKCVFCRRHKPEPNWLTKSKHN